MKTKTNTHIIILIDVSYSMSLHIHNFLYSLNKFLNELKNKTSNKTNNTYITLAQFSTGLSFITEFENIEKREEFLIDEFHISGMTALYDAICTTVKKISSENNQASNTKLFIISDGEDNSSHMYTKEDTDKLLDEAIKFGNWDVIHCHTDISLLKVPSFTYDINNISDIFLNLKLDN